MTALLAALFCGCVSHDGTYLPGCPAYAGNSIKLSDGQFVWEKFTDSVVLDDAGNVVNQFPGYPLQGSYRVAGQVVAQSFALSASCKKVVPSVLAPRSQRNKCPAWSAMYTSCISPQ